MTNETDTEPTMDFEDALTRRGFGSCATAAPEYIDIDIWSGHDAPVDADALLLAAALLADAAADVARGDHEKRIIGAHLSVRVLKEVTDRWR